MPKVHEVIALLGGKKAETQKRVTEAYKAVQKPDLFDAFHKTYKPVAEDGERLPAESKNAQRRLKEVIQGVRDDLGGLFDLVLTMDTANQQTSGAVVVDGRTLVDAVPVPTLLFLEKQLTDLKTFVESLPTPDPAERWAADPATGMLAAEPTETHRTKKVQKPIVLYDATDKHPAQTQLISEDVLAGYWRTMKYTTRVPADEKEKYLKRVEALLDAVKVARERANAAEVDRRQMGAALLGFVFDAA